MRTESEITFTLKVSGSKVLYYRGIASGESVTILIDGAEVPIPSIGAENNTGYPQKFNRNIVEVAHLQDQEVNIKLKMSNSSKPENTGNNATFALLDCDKMDLFTTQAKGVVSDIFYGKSSLSFVSNSEKSQIVFLPISYEEGWNCKINGQKADTIKLFSNFIGVLVPSGKSKIELDFVPKGLRLGIGISALSAICLIVYLVLKQCGREFNPQKMNSLEITVSAVYQFGWVSVVILIYIVPILATLFFS